MQNNLSQDIDVVDIGLIDYRKSFLIQQELHRGIDNGRRRSVLILCEHGPVITLGRSYSEESILKPRDVIRQMGIDICDTDRGGGVTLHLPGQLVVYPVFDLRLFGRDINRFLRNLEEVVILLLHDYGIPAARKESHTGVWVGDKKIASLGISIRRWVSAHGLSLNIDCDLSLFSLIRPCGQSIIMTSMVRECAATMLPGTQEIKKVIISKFRNVFQTQR